MSKEKGKPKDLKLSERQMRAAYREELKKKVKEAIEEAVQKNGVYAKEILQVLLEVSTEMNADSLKQDYDEVFQDE